MNVGKLAETALLHKSHQSEGDGCPFDIKTTFCGALVLPFPVRRFETSLWISSGWSELQLRVDFPSRYNLSA